MKVLPQRHIGDDAYVPSLDAAIRALEKRPISRDRYPTRVLILQGPVGPFFGRLQSFLQSQGVDAWRVSFHAADRLFCNRKNTLHFDGGLDSWENWLRRTMVLGNFGAIILFGSERPAHSTARKVAAAANVKVISMEEGYIRPGFITIEAAGNNASSPIAGQIHPTKVVQEQPTGVNYSSLRRMIAYGAAYYTTRGLTAFGKRRDLFHRETPLVSEAFFWTRNLARRLLGGEANFAKVQYLLEHCDTRFFLVPLQVGADANLTRFANGWNSPRLIAECIKSFAGAAPKKTRLVFKIHPMDRGHNRLTPLIKRTAAACAVADRVDVIETGSLGLLTRHSAGMITVNSTSGLSAIFHGVPLMVLGQAIYSHPELATVTPDFDRFWTSGHVAQSELREAYIAWIKQEALMPGDYYCNIGMEVAARSVLEKLRDIMGTNATVIPMRAAS